MPRLRGRLKYLPSIALGFLAALWLGSLCGTATIAVPHPRAGKTLYYVGRGSLGVTWNLLSIQPTRVQYQPRHESLRLPDLTGRFAWKLDPQAALPLAQEVSLPILWLMTALLPLAIGALTRFRFNLRMWLAWIGLIAILSATAS